MNDEQLVKAANGLARRFYKMMGYEVGADYLFYNATHPQEKLCWDMAVEAFEALRDTDIEDALANMRDEQAS